MRGKAHLILRASRYVRITPADAGKSLFAFGMFLFSKDHPRRCGEKSSGAKSTTESGGSPPQMRGKGRLLLCNYQRRRITPADAGKRHRFGQIQRKSQDHPRRCGEKDEQAYNDLGAQWITPADAGKSCQFINLSIMF